MLFKRLKIRELLLLLALVSAGSAFASTGGGLILPVSRLSSQNNVLES